MLTRQITLALALTFLLVMLTGCGDDSPTDPGGIKAPAVPTHYELSLKMSSISAVEDCESTPGNPGDFRYTLQITYRDQFDNRVVVGTMGPHEMSVGDGSVLGATVDPIRFLMPNEAGATFQVEYWLGEYDPNPDMEVHGYQNHTLDRNPDELWSAGSSWDTYNDTNPDDSYGILKFAVWSPRGDCKGFANYYLEWRPVFSKAGE